jgi:hypothetical protein
MQNFLIQRCFLQQFIAKLILSIFFVLCFSSKAHSQNGSSGNPFTALGQARTVPSAGVYYFNLGGTTFSTYVDANGWVQVAIDFGGSTGTLTGSSSLTISARGILNSTCLAALTDATEARMSFSGGTFDVTTSKAGVLQRIRANEAISKGAGDNSINDSWSGTNTSSVQFTGSGCTASANITLGERIFHACGNFNGFHWIPYDNAQKLRANLSNITSTQYFQLWVRAACAAIPGAISSNQTVCSGSTPSNVTLSGYTGSIQWQKSTDNVNFTNISGATGATLTGAAIGTITATTYIRAAVTSGTCTINSSTHIISLGTASITTTGSITKCYSASAGTATLAYSAAANSPTSYSIDWSAAANIAGLPDQSSTSFSFAAGGGTLTGINISAALPAGTYSGTMSLTNAAGCTAGTVAVNLTVTAASVAGLVSGGQTVTSATNSSVLMLIGYTGSIQWQSSTDNSNFSNISGATAATYTITNLAVTTYYRAIVTNGGCSSATSNSVAVVVDIVSPSINITGTGSVRSVVNNTATVIDAGVTVSGNLDISGFTVTITSGYTAGDVLSYTGTLPSGVTASAFNTTSRSLEFTGTTTVANWQALLRTVTLQTTSAACFPETRKVSFIAGIKFYNFFNGHFYEYRSTPASWSTAKAYAESQTYFGRKGYLATISSAAENSFINKLIAANSWIGCSDNKTVVNAAVGYSKYSSQSVAEGKFHWVTGPEKGTQLRTGNASTAENPGVAISGVYQNWRVAATYGPNEPNDYPNLTIKGQEDYGHMFGGSSGLWNDFPNGNMIGSIIEYGGMAGDVTSSQTAFTRDIFVQNAPVGSITGGNVTICSGTGTATLSYGGVGVVQRWLSSSDDFLSDTTVVAGSVSSLNVSNLSETRYYRVVVNNGSCSGLYSSSAVINVAQTAAGNISSGGISSCTGVVDLTLNGNDGNVVKWQLSSNENFSSATDINYTGTTLSYPLTVAGTYYFRVQVQKAACSNSVYSSAYPVTVNGTAVTWLGGSGNWSNGSNWCSGSVPAAGDNIVISSGTVILDTDFTVAGSLTLSGLGSLTVKPGKTLTVSGTVDFGDQPVLLQSDATGTAAIGTVSGTLTNAGNVTVERYIPRTEGSTSSSRRWRLLTTPIENVSINGVWQNGGTWNSTDVLSDTTGTIITGNQQGNAVTANANGFDFWSAISNASASIRTYTQGATQGSWTALSNTTTAGAFDNQEAYLLFIRGNRNSLYTAGTESSRTTLRATGTLKQGTKTVAINGTKGYTLLGNPYPAPLDFDHLYNNTGNSSVIKQQFWVWDAATGDYGGYKLIKNIGGTYLDIPTPFTGTTGTSTNLTIIQSGQGFFVEPVSAAGGTLTIRENDKAANGAAPVNVLFRAGSMEKMRINLYQQNSNTTALADGVMAVYDNSYTATVKDNDDVRKPNNFNENMAIVRNGTYMIMEARPLINDKDTLYLEMWNLKQQQYQLQLKAEKMEASGLRAYLEDTYLQTKTPVSLQGDVVPVNFTVTSDAASAALTRFRLVFTLDVTPVTVTTSTQTGINIHPNPVVDKTIRVQFKNMKAGYYRINLINSQGAVVYTQGITHLGGTTIHPLSVSQLQLSGYYFVQYLYDNKVFGKDKLIVQ